MLKIENLQVAYGGIQALRGISLEVPDGKIVTLIGANGAGKSTTLRTITGLVKARVRLHPVERARSCWASPSTRSSRGRHRHESRRAGGCSRT